LFDLQNIGLKKFAPAIAVTLVVAAFVSVLALYFLVIVPAQSEPTDTAGADPAETATQVTQPPTDAGGDTLVSPPVEPEPEPPSEPAPEPEPEPITLHADDYSVSVPALTGAALNPLLRAYDDGTPGSPGVDVDRDTLQIVSFSNSNRGAVETSADSKNLIYRPTEGVNERMDNYDSVEYTVQTSAGDIVKIATGAITIHLEAENFEQNESELNNLLRFFGGARNAIRANFRFADGEISNEDLSIVQYFVDNEFSDESVQIIMDLPEELSPLKDLDEHSLRKLLGVNNLFSNENFLNSVHGPDSPVKEWQWDEDYAEILRQASFIIPSLVEVIEPLKTINYDKLDLDELFERLGGDYTGLFSRGQIYNPFYITTGNATQDQLSFARANKLLVVNGTLDLISYEGLGFIGTENAVIYYRNLGKVNLNLNENVINFSLLSLLDEFGYQVGPGLSNGSVFDITFLMDKFEEKTRGSPSSAFGGYSFVLSWENGSYDNGERGNVYNAVREILGSSYSGGELETVFRVIDWLIPNTTHHGFRPYVLGKEGNDVEEENFCLEICPAYKVVGKGVDYKKEDTKKNIDVEACPAYNVVSRSTDKSEGMENNFDVEACPAYNIVGNTDDNEKEADYYVV